MHVRYPIWLRAVERPGAVVFASMFTIESVARALLATVITLQALELLGEPSRVSLVFSLVGFVGLTATFLIPFMIMAIGRRWVYTIGVGFLVAATVALDTVTLPGQILGMLLRVFGTACLTITSSLYIMQYIKGRELTRSEPLRLQFSAAAWTAGPTIGVILYQWLGPEWAYGASAGAALALLALFWVLRLSDNPVIQPANRPPPNPLRSLHRFLSQPRLRLAWVITFGRSSWWVFFFIYAPVYMVQYGGGKLQGALLVSAGNAMLFLAPLFGRLGERHGLRPVLASAFLVAGGATVLSAVAFDSPPGVAISLVIGALACVALDAVGNIPFLRSVRIYERPQMATVFRTYLDAAELLPPAFFALVLIWFDLRIVFLISGAIMMSFAFWTRYLPRSM